MDFENTYENPQPEEVDAPQEADAHPAENESSEDAKAEKFRHLAQQRTNEIIRKLQTLGNLSNPYSYHYTEEQVNIIFDGIEKQVALARQRFSKKEKPEDGFIQL